jgi:hypothetical protein
MGPTGLTAVFGMGTGGTPPVWSPESRPAGGQATPVATRTGGRSRGDHIQTRAVRAQSLHDQARHRSMAGSLFTRRPRGVVTPQPGRTDRGGQALGC